MNNIESRLKTLRYDELFAELERATGRTTREIDGLVYKFFTAPYEEWVPVVDHYEGRMGTMSYSTSLCGEWKQNIHG